MPLHFEERDILSEVESLDSALIIPCQMCPAVSTAAQERKPFLRLFRSFLASAPYERQIERLQTRLGDVGVRTSVFKSRLRHHWFMCVWTEDRRESLRREASHHDAAIVLGCNSALDTARGALRETGCQVIEGMETQGFTNAQMSVRLSGDITFENCRVVPLLGNETVEEEKA